MWRLASSNLSRQQRQVAAAAAAAAGIVVGPATLTWLYLVETTATTTTTSTADGIPNNAITNNSTSSAANIGNSFAAALFHQHPTTTSCQLLSLPNFSLSRQEEDHCHRITTTTTTTTTTTLNNLSSWMEATSTKEDTIDTKYNVDWDVPLGEGCFGAVYAGRNYETGEAVAIKKISKDLTNDATFQREMDALVSIREAGGHVNICTCREHFVENHNAKTNTNTNANGKQEQDQEQEQEQDDSTTTTTKSSNSTEHDYYYLVLDLIQGGEMFDQLCREGAYSESDAATLVRQVASALAFLHSLGIVHSDLKPENLMLSTKNTDNAAIKIVDFGCAHLVQKTNNKEDEQEHDHEHRHRGTAATPAYCPPEVLKVCHEKHANIETSFDMWSLGVILFVMLTGTHPFDLRGDKTDAQIEYDIITGATTPTTTTPTATNNDNANANANANTPPILLRNTKHTKYLSEDAMLVLEGLIEWDPSKRMTAEQLLENPWVRGETARSKKIPASDSRLKTYRKHKTKVGTSFFRSMLRHSETHGGSKVAVETSLMEAAFRQLEAGRGYVSTKELQGDTSLFGQDAKLSFSEISDLLSENMTNRYFSQDQVVYQEGEKGDSMYLINSGSVQVTSAEGFVKQRNAGEFFGEDALMHHDQKRASTVKCSTHVHVIEITRECFEKYVKEDKDVQLMMTEMDRWRHRERAQNILGLQKNMRSKTFQKGQTIFEKGSTGDTLYILEEGNVEISVDGHKVRTLREAGEATGEHAAFHGHKNYNVTAKCVSGTCRMGGIRGKDMHKLFKKNPTLAESFYDFILRRDFAKAVCAATKRPFPETEADLRIAFDGIDTGKTGELTLDRLRSIMLEFDPSYQEDEIRRMLVSMDLNKSGGLSWPEFKQIFGMNKAA